MKLNRFPKWVTAGIAGLGIMGTIATAVAPAMADQWGRPGNQDRGRRDRDRDRDRRNDDRRFYSWSDIDRKPSFDSRSRQGFYIWRDRDDIYIVSNDNNRSRPSRFSGEVYVEDGSLSNVSGYETEGNDRIRKISDKRVAFSFETSNGLDGVRFRVNGGDRIFVNLNGPGSAYLGQNKKQTSENTLIIRR
jgi:hypothetical protein